MVLIIHIYYECEIFNYNTDCVCYFFPTVYGFGWIFTYYFVCVWYFYLLIYTLIYFKILCACLFICFYWFRFIFMWRVSDVYVNICDWIRPFLMIDLFSVNYYYYFLFSISSCLNRNVHKKRLPIFIEIVHKFIMAMCVLSWPLIFFVQYAGFSYTCFLGAHVFILFHFFIELCFGVRMHFFYINLYLYHKYFTDSLFFNQ